MYQRASSGGGGEIPRYVKKASQSFPSRTTSTYTISEVSRICAVSSVYGGSQLATAYLNENGTLVKPTNNSSMKVDSISGNTVTITSGYTSAVNIDLYIIGT